MQEYKANYSDFYDDSDPEGRPYGAAKNTTTPNTIDGTPIKASMINDLFGMLHGAFVGASENASGVPALSGVPDKVGQSQFWDALKGFIERRETRLSQEDVRLDGKIELLSEKTFSAITRHGTCATAGDVAVKVVNMANGIPAPYERFFVTFDNDNTADAVQMQLGDITADVYVGKFQAGTGAFMAGVPYEFIYDGEKLNCVNSDVVRNYVGNGVSYYVRSDGFVRQTVYISSSSSTPLGSDTVRLPVTVRRVTNKYGGLDSTYDGSTSFTRYNYSLFSEVIEGGTEVRVWHYSSWYDPNLTRSFMVSCHVTVEGYI